MFILMWLFGLICVAGQISAADSIKIKDFNPMDLSIIERSDTTSWYYRLRGDINFDGIQDFIFMDPDDAGGQSGSNWTVFLQDSTSKFLKIGKLFGHSFSFSIELTPHEVRLWTVSSWRVTPCWIGYEVVTDTALMGGSSIPIYIGDGGTELGRAVREAVRISDVKFVEEKGKLTGEGTVAWSAVR